MVRAVKLAATTLKTLSITMPPWLAIIDDTNTDSNIIRIPTNIKKIDA